MYEYFLCVNNRDGSCTSRHANIQFVERAVEDHYATLRFGEKFVADVRAHISKTLDDQRTAERLLKQQLTNQLHRLDVQESNLLASPPTAASLRRRSARSSAASNKNASSSPSA